MNRELPPIHQLLEDHAIQVAANSLPRPYLKNWLTYQLNLRRNGTTPISPRDLLKSQLIDALKKLTTPYYRPLLNATGVVLHTNLGRAPFPQAGLDYLQKVTSNYCNLEFDLHSGARGSRDAHLREMLVTLTGAEAAIVVNNNAAALWLIFHTFSLNREVVISRGELIEIGDQFRLHEILTASGAKLREVGSTNRTRLKDYETACENQTEIGLLFKAHTSNFKISGFTEATTPAQLVPLARQQPCPLVYDLGSSWLGDAKNNEVHELMQAGVDLVCFSGDKLLGGPQAGIIVGKEALIQKLRRNPLYRALRLDKLQLTLLDWLLCELLQQRHQQSLPIHQLLQRPAEALKEMCTTIKNAVIDDLKQKQFTVDIETAQATMGGGSLPGTEIPTYVLKISSSQQQCELLEQFLRSYQPAILVRRETTSLRIDPFTLLGNECLKTISRAIRSFCEMHHPM